MKTTLPALSFIVLTFLLTSCDDDEGNNPPQKKGIADETIVLTNNLIVASLESIDSSKMVFKNNSVIDKITVGAVLAGDISNSAPDGFLRTVTAISTINGNKVFTTTQASLTDAIVDATTTYAKVLTDEDIMGIDSSGVDISKGSRSKALSFAFLFDKVIHDKDKNIETTADQVVINGQIICKPTFEFQIDIRQKKIAKFLVKVTLNNSSTVSVSTAIADLGEIKQEIVLRTFRLKPFSILVAGVPVPIAKQFIAIVLGLDGRLSARITAGVENVSASTAGIIYENGIWSVISDQENSFKVDKPTFAGEARVEPWLQARYQVKPYGLKNNEIYIGIRGSLIASSHFVDESLQTSIKWGVKFSGKAEMAIFDKVVVDYEKVFYEQEYSLIEANTFGPPKVTTSEITSITQNSAQCGGVVTSDGGEEETQRGVCWHTDENPSVEDNKTIDGTGQGNFVSALTGLASDTKYFVRAYAKNSNSIAYGEQASFTTLSFKSPTVSTTSAVEITANSAIVGGNVTDDGGSPITEQGIYYGTFAQPQSSGVKFQVGNQQGEFSTTLTGLNPSTKYFFTAYATNEKGTSFGEELNFVTQAVSSNEPFTDPRDGQEYDIVQIGNQTWMAENLNFNPGTGTYCYNSDPNNCEEYGSLYTWEASLNAIPDGWHLPSKAEFETLLSFFASAEEAYTNLLVGGPSGFNSKLSGFRNNDGSFIYLGEYTDFWSSTTDGAGSAWVLDLNDQSLTATVAPDSKARAFSVRCIKNEPPSASEGLVAHYPLDGNANDVSGNQNHGEIAGAVSAASDRHGNPNGALMFNGVDGFIHVPNSQSLQSPSSAITLTAWINLTSYQDVAGIITKTNTGNYGQYHLNYQAWSTPNIAFSVNTALGASANATLSIGEWHFIAVSFDGMKIKIYLNNQVIREQLVDGVIEPDNNPIMIGIDTPGSTEFLKGALDDLRIYNRALTDLEIFELFSDE